MSPLNHKRTTSSLAPTIFYVAKNLAIKRRLLICSTRWLGKCVKQLLIVRLITYKECHGFRLTKLDDYFWVNMDYFGVPHLATCIFLFFYNEPELGVEIDPGMALTPLPSSIGWGSNPRPSDREPSALPLDHSFRLRVNMDYFWIKYYFWRQLWH